MESLQRLELLEFTMLIDEFDHLLLLSNAMGGMGKVANSSQLRQWGSQKLYMLGCSRYEGNPISYQSFDSIKAVWDCMRLYMIDQIIPLFEGDLIWKPDYAYDPVFQARKEFFLGDGNPEWTGKWRGKDIMDEIQMYLDDEKRKRSKTHSR